MEPTRPGYLTTEFYITLLTSIAGLSGLVFHQDYGISDNAGAIAAGAAALASVGYAISRAIAKRPTVIVAPAPAEPAALDPVTPQGAYAVAPLPPSRH